MQTLMEGTSPLTANERLRKVKTAPRANSWLQSALLAIPVPARLIPVVYSFADQALAIGGSFLVNVALARTQTKREYGMFALTYSVFLFLTSLHNAAVLEPFTVYGSGRYRERFSEYLRLMARSNVVIGLLLSGILLLICLLFSWTAPHLMSGALVGLGLTVGVLLSGIFLRRAFYVQRQPALAAMSSLVFFMTVACGLWLTAKTHRLDSFSVFLLLALGWIAAGVAFGRRLRFGKPQQDFLELESRYWRGHWNYTKWALATAFVFQFTTQGYYWLVGGFLSAKEVGDLRAMYLLVGPIEQALIAVSYLMAPALAARYAANRIGSFLSLWKRFALAAVGVTLLFALAVRIVGKPLMHFLYAGRYDGLAAYLFVLALLPLVLWIGNTMNYALNAVEKPKFVFWAYVSSAAATFLGGIPLVMHFGLWGAVYGMLLSGATSTAAVAIYFFFNVYVTAGQQTGPASRPALSPEPLAEERR
jgi:O-antigen/teichoic acid export membrane protein